MKKKLWLIAAFLAAIAMAFSFSACGGGDKEDTGDPDDPGEDVITGDSIQVAQTVIDWFNGLPNTNNFFAVAGGYGNGQPVDPNTQAILQFVKDKKATGKVVFVFQVTESQWQGNSGALRGSWDANDWTNCEWPKAGENKTWSGTFAELIAAFKTEDFEVITYDAPHGYKNKITSITFYAE